MSGSHRGVPARIEETSIGDRCQEAQPTVGRTEMSLGWGLVPGPTWPPNVERTATVARVRCLVAWMAQPWVGKRLGRWMSPPSSLVTQLPFPLSAEKKKSFPWGRWPFWASSLPTPPLLWNRLRSDRRSGVFAVARSSNWLSGSRCHP